MAVDPRARAAQREADGIPMREDSGGLFPTVNQELRANAAICGWEHFESSNKGTPGLLVRFVCLDGPQVGETVERSFWKTENALYMLADLALALKWEEPFDESDNDDLEKVFDGAVKITVKAQDPYEKDDGTIVERYEAAFFNPTRYTLKEKEDGPVIEAAEASFSAYLQWRENNPRGGGSSSRSSSGGGSSSRSSGGGSAPPVDDEIPF